MKHIGCAIIYENNKLLLVKKAYGDFKDKWEFAGGKKEEEETIEECIKRGWHWRTIKINWASSKEREGGRNNLRAVTTVATIN